MKLLFDENLSRKLVPLVEDLFPGSAHVTSVGMNSGASDRQVWDYAGQNGFVIITADNDFLSLANTLGHPPKVILLENCDYPTNVAARIIRAEANRILEFDGDARPVLILRA
jgi:predicted nuclease of predicted toxin-antitoxin system